LHSSALITRERAVKAPIRDDSPIRAPATTNSILRAQHIRRAGATLKSMLTVMCGAITLLTAAAVLDPASLQARSIGHAPLQPPRDLHHELTRSLAALISQSRQVLLIHRTPDAQRTHIALWQHDHHDPGRINDDELAVIAHNPASHTVTVHTMQRDASAARTNDSSAALGVPSPTIIDHWLAHPAVTARVVSTGVQTISLAPAHAPGDRWAAALSTARDGRSGPTSTDVSSTQLSLFRLRLTWAGDSSDGAHDASALVESGRQAHFQEYQP
jgi:hypothetical protein